MEYSFEDNKLKINLAGFKKEEILIEQEENLLTIKSAKELKTEGKFKQPFLLQFNLSKNQTPKASLEDGILTIEFPPKEKTKIEIN